MVIFKLRSNDEREDLMKKVKRMKKFTDELEEMLEECYEEDEPEFRGSNYRKHKEWDDEDMEMKGRYGYRRGRM